MKDWIKSTLLFTTVILLGAIVVGLTIFEVQTNIQNSKYTIVLKDSLAYKSTQLSERTAYISTLQAENAEILSKLETSDSALQVLQKTVKYYEDRLSSGSVTNLVTETVFDTITEIFYVQDTQCFFINNEWITLTGLVIDTSFSFSLKTRDMFSIAILDDQTVEVSNLNPYSTTVGINTFQVIPKENKWSMGIGVGLGFQYDLFSRSLGFGPTLTLELNYKLY